MADILKERARSLLNKDFGGFKRDLIKFSQAHASGVFSDYNESSPGMLLLEQAAFVGDVLSFYIDQQFNELKQETARQVENVVAFAKSKGYKPSGKAAARGSLAFVIEVPSTTNTRGEVVPDDLYTPTLIKGAKSGGPNGTIFETLDNIYFTASLGRDVTGSRFDSSTGLPTHFALRKFVDVVAGETKEDAFTISEFKKFRTLELANEDVLEVLEVTDSEGNEWHEVDYLAQDFVFDAMTNVDEDSYEVPYVLKLVSVPRRFIVDRDPLTNKTSLIFGSGDGVSFDDELIPNLADWALPLPGRRTLSTVFIDPRNFLKTRSLGLSPYNTTITVRYRAGGGPQTNVPAKTIRNVLEAVMSFSTTNLSPLVKGAVEGSISCINLKRTDGGRAEETIQEIKQNSDAFFAAQGRVVTREDVIARTMALPAKFGKPEKVFVKRNGISALAMDLHVLSRDDNGHLSVATPTLKTNIRTWLQKYRMLTDGINILDSNVINLRCNFGVVVSSKFNKTEVLAKCLSVVDDYLKTDRMQIGQPVIISDLSAEIQNVNGVISVYELKFSNVVGTVDGLGYSSVRFDPSANTSNSILYCPENSIFEIKYPRRDLVGVAK